jgi:hypothetical protein
MTQNETDWGYKPRPPQSASRWVSGFSFVDVGIQCNRKTCSTDCSEPCREGEVYFDGPILFYTSLLSHALAMAPSPLVLRDCGAIAKMVIHSERLAPTFTKTNIAEYVSC